ncbi:MAG: hypothetical protein V7K46_29630 [Nostoc sp.]
MLKLSIMSLGLGFAAHWFAVAFGINTRTIPYIEEIMNTAIALIIHQCFKY